MAVEQGEAVAVSDGSYKEAQVQQASFYKTR